MHTDEMKKAVNACTEAGIGLTAMKTQATGWLGWTEKVTPNEKEKEIFDQIAEKRTDFRTSKVKESVG